MKIFRKSLSIVLCLAMITSLFVGIGTITASAAVTRSSPTKMKSVNMVHGGTNHTYCYGSTICSLCTAASDGYGLTVTAGTETAELSVRDNATINAFLTFYGSSSSSGPLKNDTKGYRHALIVKYKVTKIGEGGYAQLGVGTAVENNNTAWKATDIHGVGKKHTRTSNKEYTMAVVIPEMNTGKFERLLVAGAGCEIKITYIGRTTGSSDKLTSNMVTIKFSDECETIYSYAEGSDIGTSVNPFGTGAQDAKFYDENGNEVTTVSGDMTVTAVLKEQYGYRQMLDAGKGVKWYSEVATTLSDMKGSGTADDPYIITNDAELRCAIREGGSIHLKLGNDIVINDSTDPEWYNGYGLKNWIKGVKEDGSTSDGYANYEMSANSSNLFKGTFDGNGYTISGLYIDYVATGKCGARDISGFALFPMVHGGTIKNLKLKDVYIKSDTTDVTNSHAYGALIGQVLYGGATVENVAVENVKLELNRTGDATYSSSNRLTVGGVIGYGGGNITMTDVMVKNVSAALSGSYATASTQIRYHGSLIPFIASSYKHTLTNVLVYGDMDPFSVANSSMVDNGSNSNPFVVRSGSTATNVIYVGNGTVFADVTDCVTKFDNDEAFLGSLDTFYNNIGESTNWTAKKDGKLPELKAFTDQIVIDFENNSYKVAGLNTAENVYSIELEDTNSILKRASGGNNANEWGFMIGNYSGTSEKTPLEAGKAYKVTFKAKASSRVSLDYAIYSAYSYTSSNYSRDAQKVFDASTGKTSTKFPSVGNKASVTTQWQEFSTYFTAETYEREGVTYTRPQFFILTPVWNVDIYFDDFEITPCDNAVSFNIYDNKYSNPFIAENGTEISMPVNPEREDYIFEGWYADSNFANEFTATTVSGNMSAYAKWSNAVTELEVDVLNAGVNDLGLKVTNANAYPFIFKLATDSKATVTIFTASSADATDKSVVWERTFENNGTIGALIKPAIVNGGNKLFVSVNGGVATELVIGNAPTARIVEGDVNGDNAFNLKDLVNLKKMAANTVANTWMGDTDCDGYVANAADFTLTRKDLLDISTIETTKGDRTLVWSDEFSGGKLNSKNFGYLDAYRENTVTYNTVDTLNFYDGKANLKINNIDGVNYKTPNVLTTGGKMSFNKGYLEVRAKINAVPGQWAAIWLSGDKDESIVYHGEIDILETYSNGKGFANNIHAWEGSDDHQLPEGYKSSYNYEDKNFNKTEYHIFGFEWNDTEIIYYVDGVEYGRSNITTIKGLPYDGENIFTKSYPFADVFNQFYALRLDNMIYSSLTSDGAMPEFNIDYVRLYQKDGEQLKINGELVAK